MNQARRARWRGYLLLSRVSNAPTVWSNVLAGMAATQAAFDWLTVLRVGAGITALYTAGMFLNDAFDRDFDATHRPERPLPAGDLLVRHVVIAASVLLVAGEALIGWQPRGVVPLAWGLALAGAIVYYDLRHKGSALAPLVMGVCRGLVYCVAAAAIAASVSVRVLASAAALAAYVVMLTVVAKRLGARGGTVVPRLIAGISLVDAGVILANGGSASAAAAAGSMAVVTLLLQRYVPGD